MFLKISQISLSSNCVGVIFNKVAGRQNCDFIKKRLVKFAKFLRIPYFTEHLQWLLLTVSGFPPATLLKKEIPAKMSFCEFYKILRASFDRTPPDAFLLTFICEFWEVFQNTSFQSFIEHIWETAYSMYKLEFQPADTVKTYFTGAFQAFYTSTRSSRSKAFIYLKSLKIICEEVNS